MRDAIYTIEHRKRWCIETQKDGTMGQTSNHHEAIYISPEDDLTTIFARIELATAKEIVLVIPHSTFLKTTSAWHSLYLYARRHKKHIQVISDSAYIRSIAHSVRFKSAKTLDELLSEKPVYTRPSQHFSSPNIPRQQADTVEGINFLFANDDVEIGLPKQDFPHADVNDTPLSFLFDEEEDLPPLRSTEQIPLQPIRLPIAPKPVDIRPVRRLQPEPRLPWDDEDDLPAPQPPKFVRRRTNPLVRSMKQNTLRRIRYHRPEPLRLMEVLPVVLVGLFLIVRAIVRYMKSRTL
jgi:hypothetical protein